jgi:putative transposase
MTNSRQRQAGGPRVLTVIDAFTRFSPAIYPRMMYRGADDVATFQRACRKEGRPRATRLDQGGEFVSRILNLLAYLNNVTLDVARPKKPATMRSSRPSTGVSEQSAGDTNPTV